MMDMEELQKACETLAEAWNKTLGPMEKLAKALSDAFGQMYASEEEKHKPVVKRNLPYQRRNF